MKIRAVSISVAVALSLIFLQPPKADAKTSVYISVGVGGAAIVGGAYLFWSLSYGSRVSGGIPEGPPSSKTVYSLTNIREQRYRAALDRFVQERSQERETPAIQWPLFTYRW